MNQPPNIPLSVIEHNISTFLNIKNNQKLTISKDNKAFIDNRYFQSLWRTTDSLTGSYGSSRCATFECIKLTYESLKMYPKYVEEKQEELIHSLQNLAAKLQIVYGTYNEVFDLLKSFTEFYLTYKFHNNIKEILEEDVKDVDKKHEQKLKKKDKEERKLPKLEICISKIINDSLNSPCLQQSPNHVDTPLRECDGAPQREIMVEHNNIHHIDNKENEDEENEDDKDGDQENNIEDEENNKEDEETNKEDEENNDDYEDYDRDYEDKRSWWRRIILFFKCIVN
jgi:hypothetical protein